jgi:competence protein ComEC
MLESPIGGRVGEFCKRHPLFAAALVAVASVAAARWNFPASLGLAALLGIAGSFSNGRRTGLAWLLCGWIAAGVFTGRSAQRESAERALLAAPLAEMEGRVLADAQGRGRIWRAPVLLLTGSQAGNKVWWEGRGERPVAGSRIKASGNFSPLPEPRNPGEFDQADWLRNQGVAAVFQAGWAGGEVSTGWWPALGARLRHGFRNAVTAGLDPQSSEAAVIRAMVIGEQPPDAEDLIAAFRNSGTLHAFCVSGLHVGMVGAIGWLVLRLLGVSRRWAVLGLMPLIFGYAWLTGNGPPAVRSAWMALAFLGAFVFRRQPDLLNALGAVLLVAMLWDGRLLFQAGVQLSYGVVATIAIGVAWASRIFAWIAKPELYLPLTLMTRSQRLWLEFRTRLAQSLAVSLAAGVGATPLMMFHFRLFAPVSVLAGVVMVPGVFVVLGLGLTAAALFPWVPFATQRINQGNAWVAKACIFTAESFASLPGGHFHLQEPEPFLLIYDLDEGSGAACFSGGKSGAVLLDCGDPYHFKRLIAPSLRRLGSRPDAVVLSHPDGDHLGGGQPVWKLLPIRQALLPVQKSRSPAFRSWAQDAPAAGVKIIQAADLSEIPMPDGARLEILHAPHPTSQNIRADSRVAIYRLHWRGWKLLFTSDAGSETELKLLASQQDLAADVIIAGRNDHDINLTDDFLDAVDPQLIVASHADFPSEEQLDPAQVAYWRTRGIHVFHQGETGGVTLRVDAAGSLVAEGFVNRARLILKPR